MTYKKISIDKLKQEINNFNQKIVILTTDEDDRVYKAKKIIESEFKNLKYKKIDQTFFQNFNQDIKQKLLNQFIELRKNKEDRDTLIKKFNNDLNYFATLLVKNNYASGIVSGCSQPTANILRPSFQIIGPKSNSDPISSFMWLFNETKNMFFADISVIPNPNPSELGSIGIQTAISVKNIFEVEPILAMLSFSTNGSGGNHEMVQKVKEATKIIKNENIEVVGEIQWDAAIDEEVFKLKFPNSDLKTLPNIFIFPDLNSGNIGYKIAKTLGNFKAIGPILQNINKPINDLSRSSSVAEIVELVIVTANQFIKSKL